MRFFKELKLIKWPSFIIIIKEYFAILLCTGVFLGVSALANLLIAFLIQMAIK